MPQVKARTTVALPPKLLEAVDRAIAEGFTRNRNEFLATALRNQLAQCRRAAIDAAFADMASDPDYRSEALEISEAFGSADREAMGLAVRRS